jgi:hypothetical protein
MVKLKLNSVLRIFDAVYSVKSISRKGVTFALSEAKPNAANELVLSLREVEEIIFGKQG